MDQLGVTYTDNGLWGVQDLGAFNEGGVERLERRQDLHRNLMCCA